MIIILKELTLFNMSNLSNNFKEILIATSSKKFISFKSLETNESNLKTKYFFLPYSDHYKKKIHNIKLTWILGKINFSIRVVD